MVTEVNVSVDLEYPERKRDLEVSSNLVFGHFFPKCEFGLHVKPCAQFLPAAVLPVLPQVAIISHVGIIVNDNQVTNVVPNVDIVESAVVVGIDQIHAKVMINDISVTEDDGALVISPLMYGIPCSLLGTDGMDIIEDVEGDLHFDFTSPIQLPSPDRVVVDAVQGRLWPRKRGR